MRAIQLSLAALVLAACKTRDPVPEPKQNPVTEAVPSASGASFVDAALAPPSDDEKSRFVTYSAALMRGRNATVAKKYADAIAAFDEALTARPNDARALSERGYAELLAGKYDDASEHLALASTTTDPALSAQVWFNLGLVDEAKKNSEAALVDFWFSDTVRGSAAAKAKLAGREVCPVNVDAKPAPSTKVASWREVARLVRASLGEMCRVVPASDTDAERELSFGAKVTIAGKGDFVLVRTGNLERCGTSSVHLVQTVGKDLYVSLEVGSGFVPFNHPSEDEVVLSRLGDWIRVSQRSSPSYEHAVCQKPGDGGEHEISDCTGAPGEIYYGHAFPQSSAVYIDHVFDPDRHARVLKLEDAVSARLPAGDGGRQTLVRAEGDAVKLEGCGCHRTFSRGDGGL